MLPPKFCHRTLAWLAGLFVFTLLGLIVGCSQFSISARSNAASPTRQADDAAVSWAWGEARKGVRLGIAAANPDQAFDSIIHPWRKVADEGGHVHMEPGPGESVLIRYQIMNDGKRGLFFYGPPTTALVSSVEVWVGGRIFVVGPDGKPLSLRLVPDNPVRSKTAQAVHQKKTVAYNNKRIDLPPGQPFEGTISLTDYFDFPKPGSYRVSLHLRLHYKTLWGGDKSFSVGSTKCAIMLTSESGQAADSRIPASAKSGAERVQENHL